MGCWGMGIMQSDDALDAELEIMEVVGLDWDSTNKKDIKKGFTQNFNDIAEVCNKYKSMDTYLSSVYWQVLAYISMKNGVHFDEEKQNKIIAEIKECHEYKIGSQYSDREELHKNLKEQRIKEFGKENWDQNVKIWGEYSSTDRVIERTKNINQLLEDFSNFHLYNSKGFERKEEGLLSKIKKKM